MSDIKSIKRIFGVVTILFWVSLTAYGSYISPIVKELGANATIIGLVGSSYGFVQTFARIPIGLFSDTINRKKVFIIAGALMTTVASIGITLAASPFAVLIFRCFSGLGVSTWICFTVLYSSYFPPEKATGAITNTIAFANAGMVVGGLLGSGIAYIISLRAPSALAAIAGVTAFIMSFSIKDVRIEKERPKFKELFLVLKDKGLVFSAIIYGLFMVAGYGTALSFTSLVIQDLGGNNFEIGFASILMSVSRLLAASVLLKYMRRAVSEKMILLLSFIMTCIYCLLIPTAAALYQIYILQIFMGFAWSSLDATAMSMSIRTIDPGKKSTAMGIYQAIYGCGMMISPVIMGIFVDMGGYFLGYSILGLAAVAAIGIIFASYNKIYGVSTPEESLLGIRTAVRGRDY